MKNCYKGILYTHLIILSIASCTSKKPCLPPQVSIKAPKTIYAGDSLNLTAESVPGAIYSWSGPDSFSSVKQNPTIYNASVKTAGVYSVTVKSGECENSASQNVNVLAGPTCSLSYNTINLLSTMTFDVIQAGLNTDGRYEINGSGQQGDVSIQFYVNPFEKGDAAYELSTMDNNPNNAFMQIDVGGVLANWQATSGKLYVKVVNGKLTASFCGAQFGNIQSSYTKNGSGSISK